MARGLDELVEALVGEISYFGNGCTISELISAIKKFHSDADNEEPAANNDALDVVDQDGSSNQATDAVLSLAHLAWDWLVRRGEVRVGPEGEWNHLSMDDVIALPEETIDEPTEAQENGEASESKPESNNGRRSKKRPLVRPRLFVDEETVWRTLTGHGVDYKRVPMLEWKALIGIASAKETGILQGDLIRLTGQDKRSVPKRTDFLTQKGYIAKRTTMIRGCKTSRLWLTKLAPSMLQDTEPSASRSQGFQMSTEALIDNLEPVPWCDKWNGDNIDYLAFGQTYMALVKAWKVIRFRDLKQKLGILERRWQMKILAKESRRFAAMGVVKYAAAVFQDNRQVFKDCIKYVRDLTDDEWRKFLATGKRSSLYSDQTQHRQPNSTSISTGKQPQQSRNTSAVEAHETGGGGDSQDGSKISEKLSPWAPEKPLTNTVYENIRRTGRRGISNPRLSAAVTGFSFRRYMFTNLNFMTSPNAQPPHLQDFQLRSELVRIGKTSSYLYFVEEFAKSLIAHDNRASEATRDQSEQDPYGLPLLPAKVFGANLTTLSELGSVKRSRPRAVNAPEARAVPEALDHGAIAMSTVQSTPSRKPRGRPRKQKLSHGEDSAVVESQSAATDAPHRRENLVNESDQASQMNTVSAPESGFQDRPTPGVYIGQPGSLNPNARGKVRGRPKKSLVVIFKSDKIRNVIPLPTREPDLESAIGQQLRIASRDDLNTENDLTHNQDDEELLVVTPENDAPASTGAIELETADLVTNPDEPSSRRGRGRKSSKPPGGKYRCEKCGKSWKNDNGLAYHLEKSRTTCNVNYAQGPSVIEEDKPRKRRKMLATPLLHEQQNLREASASVASTMPKQPSKVVNSSGRKLARRRAFPATGFLAPTGFPTDFDTGGIDPSSGDPRLQSPADDVQVEAKQMPASPTEEQIMEETPADNKLIHVQSSSAADKRPKTDVSHRRAALGVHATKPETSSHSQLTRQVNQVGTFPPAQDNMTYVAEQSGPSASPRKVLIQAGSPLSPRQEKIASTAHTERADLPLNGDSTRPRFRMPDGRDFSRLSESQLRTYQATEIVRYLLDNNDGVFPAEKALYYAVSHVWKMDLGGDVPPSSYSCGVAVKNLTRINEVKLETYSSRNSRGAFVFCQLILRTNVAHHGPAAVALKARVLAAHPDLYIPKGYSPPSSELQRSLEKQSPKKGPGRRDLKIAEDIEVLNAPFYVRRGLKGVRAGDDYQEESYNDDTDDRRKRKATEDGFGNFRIKRQRSTSVLSAGEHGEGGLQFKAASNRTVQGPLRDPQATRRLDEGDYDEDALVRLASFGSSERQLRWQDPGADGQPSARKRGRPRKVHQPSSVNPGLHTLPSNFFSYDAPGPILGAGLESLNLNFLEPNTDLYEQPPEQDKLDPRLFHSMPTASDPAGNDAISLEVLTNPPFVNFLVLKSMESSSEAWPDYGLAFFENNSTSFTMRDSVSRHDTVLRQGLPHTVDDMARRTMCRFKPEEWADPYWGRFVETINGCARWEVSKTGQGRLSLGSVAPAYIFINTSSAVSVSNMNAIDPLWHEGQSWTLATIPYIDLDSEDDEDEKMDIEDANRGRLISRARHGFSHFSGPPNDMISPRKKRPYTRRAPQRPPPPRKVREQVVYPKASEDYARDKNDKQAGLDWAADDTKIAAFVSVGVLLGGLGKNIDWGLMCRLFPEMKVSGLRRFWKDAKKDREAFINDLTDRFQVAFVEAYEKDELPAIDFNDVLSYDWPLLVNWTLQLTIQNTVLLPPTRTELESDFSMQALANTDRDWRESYHHWQRSVFNKFQDATSEAAAASLDRPSQQQLVPDLMALAKTWIRTLCCTPLNKYTSQDIKNKFLQLGGQSEEFINVLLETAIIDLERAKIAVKNKSKALATGRPYRLNDHFLKILERYAQEEKFALASKFKAELDEKFREGEDFTIPYDLDDGMVLAIMNLQAYGRVRVESVGQPDVPFGFEPGNYETRKFPKSYYHWGLQISPTDAYIFDEDIHVLDVAKQYAVPGEIADGRLPLWCDFFGELDNKRWANMVGAVLFLVATRGNLDSEAASLALQPCVEIFEAEAIMAWAREVGLMQEMTAGGGLTVCEWWWLVVGQQINREGDNIGKGQELLGQA